MEDKILLDIEINKRCIEEETNSVIKRLLELWLEYDYELLALLKEKKCNK